MKNEQTEGIKLEIKLKEFREKHNITQAQAAESIQIDQRQWSRYEQGKNELPIHYLYDLCVYWKESADWVLGLKDKR